MCRVLSVVAVGTAFLLPYPLAAQVRTLFARDAAELMARVAILQPGDRLQLADHEYRLPGLTLRGLRGAAGRWIVIRGAPNRGTRIVGTSTGSNVIDIEDCAWLRLEDLDITSEGRTVDGVKFRYGSISERVVIDHCRIHDVGQGITSQATLLTNLEVRGCEVTRTSGSGIYLGYDSPPRLAVGTWIHDCWIHDCARGGTTGYGIQIKGNSHSARIENNVLHEVAGTSRAAIATYFVDAAGVAPRERWNTIRDNVIWSTPNTGIYVTNGAVVENNTVFDAARGIATTAYGGVTVANLVVRNNTLFRCAEAGMDFGGFGSARTESIVIANNASLMPSTASVALRIQSGPGRSVFTANAVHGAVPGPVQGGLVAVGPPAVEFVAAASGASPPQLDLRPAAASALRGIGRRDLAPDTDTVGIVRRDGTGTDCGAWLHANAAAVWTMAPGFKRALGGLRPLRATGAPGSPGTIELVARFAGLPDAPYLVIASEVGPTPGALLPIGLDPLTHEILGAPSRFIGYAGTLRPDADGGTASFAVQLGALPELPHPITLYHAVVALRPDGSLATSGAARVVLE